MPCHFNIFTMNDKEITQQFLSQFPRQIDGLVYLFLRSIAHEGIVHSSGYALSKKLGIYRTTLFRILYQLEQQRMIRLVKDDSLHAQSNLSITLLLEPTQHTEKNDPNVTLPTENVTLPAENVTLPTENVTPQAETVTAIPCYDDSTDDTENGKMKPQKKTKEENPPAPPKEKNKRKNSHSYARVSQQNLETRREAFIDSLAAFSSIYGNEMLQAFADYWTEPNRSLTRMRFEMQKTWSTALRLATWARNEASFGQRRCSQPRPTTADCIRDAQQYAMEQAMLVLSRAEEKRQLRQLF